MYSFVHEHNWNIGVSGFFCQYTCVTEREHCAMDFTLNEEQQAIRDTCRDFAEQEIKPLAEEMDRTGEFPYEIVRKMGELGLLGLPFPEEYGGAGADFLAYCIAIEEISRGDVSVGITMEAHTSLGASPFYLFGSQEQKEQYLTPLARGEQLWAFGLTEPEAGSDSGGTQTRAVLREGHWHINGSKSFITNAGTDMTGGVTITAVTGKRSDSHKEITSIIVPRDTPGYIIGNPYKKMGWKASDTRPLTFEDCVVPEESILGQRGDGFKQFMQILDAGRIAIAALSVGLAQACLDEALSYAKERKQFGQHLSKFQAIQFKLADMEDRKSTRLNSSHGYISYAVFCLNKTKDAHNGQSGGAQRWRLASLDLERQPRVHQRRAAVDRHELTRDPAGHLRA